MDFIPGEAKTFELLARGLSNMEIAREQATSYHTVRAHVRNIFSKLNVSNRVDGEVAAEDARRWLLTETAQFFADSSTRDFSFLVMADAFVADDESVT